jgi:dihydrofolate reductase
MTMILYALTKDGYFSKKDNVDGKIDDLAWMRVTTDRRLFKQLTTLHNNQPIIAGYKTVDTLPKLPGRKIISISTCAQRGMLLRDALQRYPDGIVIGGASVIKSCIHFGHRDLINSILTVKLPLKLNPEEDPENFFEDPLRELKDNNVLRLDETFFIHTERFDHPTVQLEIWRPTYNGSN